MIFALKVGDWKGRVYLQHFFMVLFWFHILQKMGIIHVFAFREKIIISLFELFEWLFLIFRLSLKETIELFFLSQIKVYLLFNEILFWLLLEFEKLPILHFLFRFKGSSVLVKCAERPHKWWIVSVIKVDFSQRFHLNLNFSSMLKL